MTTRKAKNQGSKWIRPVKRLAIYLRDGMACAYCGASVEDGAQLSLDHLKPYCEGGSNEAGNLVTCCHRCNSSRGARSWRKFAAAASEFTGVDRLGLIARTVRRVLPMAQAAELMQQRKSS